MTNPSGNETLESSTRVLIEKTRSLLKEHSPRIGSETVNIINSRVRSAENALSNGEPEGVERARTELKKTYSKHLSRHAKSRLRQNIEALAFAVLLAFGIRTFIVQPFKIPSGSMIPTLLIGDHLLVNKFIYGTHIPFTDNFILPIKNIDPGDVVVFTYPNYEKDPTKEGIYYIKRVVGLPGDSIDLKGRQVVINGRPVPIEYIDSDGSLGEYYDAVAFDLYTEDLFGHSHKAIYDKSRESTQKGLRIPVDKVPDGHYFVMGDNRDNSLDSRFWGFVPRENIVGKAFIIHWSWNSARSGMTDFIRWQRLGSLIN